MELLKPPLVMVTTNGDTVEALADLCVRRIIEVADTAPEPIREQAIAFRRDMREVIYDHMKRAVAAEFRRFGGTS